jgi:hypothetical protein
VDASGAADLCHSEGTIPVEGELVHFLTGKNVPEHQIVHLELPTIHEPLVIVLEHLTVSCILESCLPSSLIDEVDIITPELVLCGFVICLDTGGDHGDFQGDNDLCPVNKEERHLPRGLT